MAESPRAPSPAPIEGLPETGIRAQDGRERDRSLLLRNANVVDVSEGSVLPHSDVLIASGTIAAVGSALQAADAPVVDMSGRYLMPGLISLHVHPGLMVGVRMDPDGQTPERIVRDLQVYLRYGVTTVQAMGADRDFTFDVQRQQRQGAFAGARLLTVGHGFGVQGGVPPFKMDPPGPVRFSEPTEIVACLEDLAARGASGVKLWYDDWYGQMPKMAPRVAETIIRESRRLGLKTYAHVYRVEDARMLVDMGLDVLAHMPRDRDADAELVDVMLANGAAAVPTLTVPESNYVYVDLPGWVDDPFFGRFLPPGSAEWLRDSATLAAIAAKPETEMMRADLVHAQHNTRLLHEGGALVGFGTDTGVSSRVVGFCEHRELELLVLGGIPPAAALKMATLDSAKVLNLEGSLGEVAPGRRADLLVLGANPLDDVRNTRSIQQVWQDGVLVAGPVLDR